MVHATKLIYGFISTNDAYISELPSILIASLSA